MKKQNKKKIIALIVSMVFVIALSISSVSAYLTAKTDPIENTFTAATSILTTGGKFEIKEHTVQFNPATGWENTGSEFVPTQEIPALVYSGIMPKMKIEKDPVVKIDAAINAYVFLKIDATNMTKDVDLANDVYSWDVAAGWNIVQTTAPNNGLVTYLYYRAIEPTGDPENTTVSLQVLKNNEVVVADYGTADAVAAAKQGSLKFTAYAIQAFQVEIADADDALAVFEANF